MNFRLLNSLIAFGLFFTTSSFAAPKAPELLPSGDEIGWPEIQTIICRTESDLFDYMDGGAELYFGFNFRRLAARKYLGPNDIEMTIESFLLKSDADAYGLMSMLPIDQKMQLGDMGSYSIGTLRFIAGPYYYRIFLTGDFDHYSQQIKKAGEIAAAKIQLKGNPPPLIRLMPASDRKHEGLHFFHDYIAFKNLFFLHIKNILELTNKNNVVMGEYCNIAADIAALFLIQYPDYMKCSNAYKNAVSALFHQTDTSSLKNFYIQQLNPSKWIYIELSGSYILLGVAENHNTLMMDRMTELKANLSAFLKGR